VLAHTGVAVAWIAGLGALVTLCGWMLLRRVNRI
jgi:LPXTG-motif cell wall-anchored protein